MTTLSSEAQAVLDAVVSHPEFATRKRIASALRAAADQIVPPQTLRLHPDEYDLGVWEAEDCVRTGLLDIATELEEQ